MNYLVCCIYVITVMHENQKSMMGVQFIFTILSSANEVLEDSIAHLVYSVIYDWFLYEYFWVETRMFFFIAFIQIIHDNWINSLIFDSFGVQDKEIVIGYVSCQASNDATIMIFFCKSNSMNYCFFISVKKKYEVASLSTVAEIWPLKRVRFHVFFNTTGWFIFYDLRYMHTVFLIFIIIESVIYLFIIDIIIDKTQHSNLILFIIIFFIIRSVYHDVLNLALVVFLISFDAQLKIMVNWTQNLNILFVFFTTNKNELSLVIGSLNFFDNLVGQLWQLIWKFGLYFCYEVLASVY